MLSFECDNHTNEINILKHKISFEEAQTVFYDERALVIDDPDHSAKRNNSSFLVSALRPTRLLCAIAIVLQIL